MNSTRTRTIVRTAFGLTVAAGLFLGTAACEGSVNAAHVPTPAPAAAPVAPAPASPLRVEPASTDTDCWSDQTCALTAAGWSNVGRVNGHEDCFLRPGTAVVVWCTDGYATATTATP